MCPTEPIPKKKIILFFCGNQNRCILHSKAVKQKTEREENALGREPINDSLNSAAKTILLCKKTGELSHSKTFRKYTSVGI